MNTIHDVAKAAGVSISTVSYALSGKRSISPATRERVERVAAELNYRPNARAKALASQRTSILAVTEPLRPDTSAPAHMAFVMATATAARRYDYDVLLLTQEEAGGGLERVTATGMVDGIVILDVLTHDPRVELARTLRVPSVVVGVPADPEGLVCVDLDFEAVGERAAARLVEAGHQGLGFIGHQSSSYADNASNFPPRLLQGLRAGAEQRHATLAVQTPDPTPAAVRVAVEALLATDPRPTGLVIHAEEAVHTITLDVLAEYGVQVPHDLSVISAASTFDTTRFTPALDCIPLVPERSCDRAVELVVQLIGGAQEPVVELLPPTYTEHGSVCPPTP